MLSCIRKCSRFFICQVSGSSAFKISSINEALDRNKRYQPRNHQFHIDCCSQTKISSKLTQKYEDDGEENIQFVVVKAPPGAADSTVPGKLEWLKIVGTRVNIGEIVCRIRFKDLFGASTKKGRTLDIPAPSKGVIAVRKKNEGDPVQHSEELFKIRLDPDIRYTFKKKKKKKSYDSEEEEKEENSVTADAGLLKAAVRSSYLSNQDHAAHMKNYSLSKSIPEENEWLLGSSGTQQETKQHSSADGSSSKTAKYPAPFGGNNVYTHFQVPIQGINSSLMTTVDEINMEGTIQFFQKQERVLYPDKPSIRSMYIKAAAFVLRMNPTINIKILNNEVIQKKSIDVTLGLRYLKVMVFHTFKDVEKLTYMDISRILKEIKKQVAEGTYRAKEKDFDFTVSQEWERGSVFGTPKYSKTCNLGLHKIIKRPIVDENKIVAYPMMYASLTYDNSMIPDEDAIKFLKMFKLAIEEPRYMLINSM